jgi:hypothetical protein
MSGFAFCVVKGRLWDAFGVCIIWSGSGYNTLTYMAIGAILVHKNE